MREALEAIAKDPRRKIGISSLRYGEFELQSLNGILLPQYLLSLLKENRLKEKSPLLVFTDLVKPQYLMAGLRLHPDTFVTDGRAVSHRGGFFIQKESFVSFEGKTKYEDEDGSQIKDGVQIQTIKSRMEMEDLFKMVGFLDYFDEETGKRIAAKPEAGRWNLMWREYTKPPVEPSNIADEGLRRQAS